MADANPCTGPGCSALPRNSHSVECRFQHFLAYMQYSRLPADEIARLRMAYGHGAEGNHG